MPQDPDENITPDGATGADVPPVPPVPPAPPAAPEGPQGGAPAGPPAGAPGPGPGPAQGGSTWGQAALDHEGQMPMLGAAGSNGSDPADGATGVPGGSSGSGGRSGSGRRVGPKPIRGPRFSASPVVAGLGLLSLLVVIAIMAILAVKVMDGTTAKVDIDEGTAGVIIDSGNTDSGGTDSGGTAPSGTGMTVMDAAKVMACRTDRQTIATAVSVYDALYDEQPTSIDQLVAEQLLKEDPGGFELRQGADGVEVVATGDCEGVD